MDSTIDGDQSDEHYARLVEELKQRTAREIAAAPSDLQVATAIERFVVAAYSAKLVAGELTDFFCVDDDSVVERLGLSDDQADNLVRQFDFLHDSYVRKSRS